MDNSILRKAKIKMVAYKGGFDGICSKREIAEAKKKGLCPTGFEVHHVIPLNCKESTLSVDNMVIIDSKAHKWLHDNLYTPALIKCQEGQYCYIRIPDMDKDKAITIKDIQPFIDAYNDNQRRIAYSKIGTIRACIGK